MVHMKGTKCFTILNFRSTYHCIAIHPESRPKTIFTCPCRKFQWKRVAFGVQTAYGVFLILMFNLFFKYLDNFLAFWMDDMQPN